MRLEIPHFATRKELFAFLIENKSLMESQKKSSLKFADGIGVTSMQVDGSVNKADSDFEGRTELQVKVAINTTNILDSHGDVHIKGLWNKSLKENKRILHVQEHKSNEFDKIISSGEDLQASVKMMTWKELGYEAEGKTQVLLFDSLVKESRNKFMFDQYKSGYVGNHSVGMRYMKMEFAVNDEDYVSEKATWDKYYADVVNKDDLDAKGYMWIITEAKAIEGSAVPMGSNPITPTISTKTDLPIAKTEVEKSNQDIITWLKK